MTYTHSITAYRSDSLIWDREKKDVEYSRCIGLYIVLNEVNAFIQQYFMMHEIPYGAVKSAIMGLLFLIFLRSIIHFNRKEYIALFTTLGIVTFLYIYSAIAGAEISYMATWAVNSFGVGVPLATFAYLIEDKGKLYSFLYKCTWPILVMLVFDFALFHETDKEYSLHFGYMMLFILIFHLSYALNEKKIVLIPFIIAELALIIVYGSRAALICLAAYIALRFITIPGKKELKMIVILAIALLIPATAFVLKYIVPGLVVALQEQGLRARTLDLLRENRMFDLWNRMYIWEPSVELIKQKPLFGWGIREASKYRPTAYPHNLFLDFWESFGYIFGTTLFIPILFLVSRLFKPNRTTEAEICRIYVSMEFVKLLVSQTFITSYQFYIMMGLLIAYNHNNTQNIGSIGHQ